MGDVINQINSAAMLTPTTPISQLNDGRGVALPSGTDLTINFADGSSLPISITSSTSLTLGGLINQLNDDAGGKLTAALAGNALVLTAAQSFSVAGLANGHRPGDYRLRARRTFPPAPGIP